MKMACLDQINKNTILFTLLITFFIITISIQSCSKLPTKDNFFTIEDYKKIGSRTDFNPIPIYEKLIKYDMETVNKNLLKSMRYSLDMLSDMYGGYVLGDNATFLDVFIRLFWFRVLLNKDNIDITPELNMMKNYNGNRCDWFTVQIFSALLSNFYTEDFFTDSYCYFYNYEGVFSKMQKEHTNIDYNKIAEKLALKTIQECPDALSPYYYLVLIYGHSNKCNKTKKYFNQLERCFSTNSKGMYSGFSETIKSYNEQLKKYITQFCDMEDLKN